MKDGVGCMLVYFVVFNGIGNFEVIFDRGGDIYVKDKLGCVVLYWVVYGGCFKVVEWIIVFLDDKEVIDVFDIDGWMLFCWVVWGF